jgi:hypothetical protein
MIFTFEGKRIGSDHPHYQKVLTKIKEDYPGFGSGEKAVIIMAKEGKSSTRSVYRGNTEADAEKVRDQRFPPKPQFITEIGEYVDENGLKQVAVWSDYPPAMKDGHPVWADQTQISIFDGMHIVDEEKAVWLYGFKKEIHGGFFVNDYYNFEFHHPELKAKAKRVKGFSEKAADEILYEGTCMSWDAVKKVASILQLASVTGVNEDLDRQNLYDYVVVMPVDRRDQYEQAKLSSQKSSVATQEQVSKTVKAAWKAGLFVEDANVIYLKRSELNKEKVIELKGEKNDQEKMFSVSEYYFANVQAFDDLQKLVK